jgi:glycerophosphoryl diester phosphodiesterase
MPEASRPYERIAHRGASRERLENTQQAFTLALDRGADAVELDVHRTRDGVVVVHHDFLVGRLAMANADWAALSEVELAGGNRIPRLEDVLMAIGDRATVYIELKGPGVEADAIAMARRHGVRYAVHSFDHSAVERAKRIAPDVARGVLLDRGTPNPAARLAEAHRRVSMRDVWPHYSLVDEAFMVVAAKLAVRVIVWTVNSAADAKRLIELGVAGVCTDDVRILDGL